MAPMAASATEKAVPISAEACEARRSSNSALAGSLSAEVAMEEVSAASSPVVGTFLGFGLLARSMKQAPPQMPPSAELELELEEAARANDAARLARATSAARAVGAAGPAVVIAEQTLQREVIREDAERTLEAAARAFRAARVTAGGGNGAAVFRLRVALAQAKKNDVAPVQLRAVHELLAEATCAQRPVPVERGIGMGDCIATSTSGNSAQHGRLPTSGAHTSLLASAPRH